MKVLLFEEGSDDINAIGFCCKGLYYLYNNRHIRITQWSPDDKVPEKLRVIMRMYNGNNSYTSELKYCPCCGAEVSISTTKEVANETKV